VCDGFHDAADHHAVGQNIEVIVTPFVGQTAHVDRKAVRQQNRTAVRGGGEQFEGAAAVVDPGRRLPRITRGTASRARVSSTAI